MLATIENLHHSESDVMLIYDRNLDLKDLSKLKDFCKDKEWKCFAEDEVVGAEASTVIIYDLEAFDFEAFTRAINNLTMVTTRSTKLERAVRKIWDGEHDDEECRINRACNEKHFKCQRYECPYIGNAKAITKLLEQAKYLEGKLYVEHLGIIFFFKCIIHIIFF